MCSLPHFRWSDLLLIGLIALGETATIALWLPLLAGAVGHDTLAPHPAGLVVIGMVAFWTARSRAGRSWIPVGLWLLLLTAWLYLSTALSFGGWLEVLLAAIAWWRGASLASVSDLSKPERAHRLLAFGVLSITAAVMTTFAWHSPASHAARQAAVWAVPVLILCALLLAAIGVADVVEGSGGTFSRHRISAIGLTAGLVLVAIFLVLLLSGNANDILGMVQSVTSVVGFVLFWIVAGVAYVFFYLIIGVLRVLGIHIDFPRLGHGLGTPQNVKKEHHPVPLWFELAIIVLVAMIVVALLYWYMPRVMRFLKRRGQRRGLQIVRDGIHPEGSLLTDLRNLFAGFGLGRRRTKVDLRAPPISVRDAYRKLLILAAQEGQCLTPVESPRDFAQRLATDWSELSASIENLTSQYVAVRYGDIDASANLAYVSEVWQHILRVITDNNRSSHNS